MSGRHRQMIRRRVHGGLYAEDMERLYHGPLPYLIMLIGAGLTVAILTGTGLALSYVAGLAPEGFWENPWVRGAVGAVLWALVVAVGGLYLTLVERKFMARVQVRYGPNRWGPYGILQPIADAIKLLRKEDIIPEAADPLVMRFAPIIAFAPSFVLFAAVPWTESYVASTMDIGVLFIVAVTALTPIGVLMAGWGPNNKYNLLGAMRFAAQELAYEIPLVLAMIGPIAAAQSLNGVAIVEAQRGTWLGLIPRWNIFPQFLGAIIFFVAFMAETGRIPFDIPDAEGEIVHGFTAEYSGMKFVLLLLIEYVHLIAGAALFVVLFMGGYLGPAPINPFAWFALKLLLVILFMMLIRAVWFRVRIDQIMTLGWKILLPAALFNIGFIGIYLAVTV
ncbi:MAG: NADH-quinone oxidoreductase subunit NuoH [Methanobacteriota archaeon]|nr:MAG: NADH-quinone oxidoreductase subunit NuoH [Euryarchaeota archaeon]